jgi:hypothetical protein
MDGELRISVGTLRSFRVGRNSMVVTHTSRMVWQRSPERAEWGCSVGLRIQVIKKLPAVVDSCSHTLIRSTNLNFSRLYAAIASNSARHTKIYWVGFVLLAYWGLA